MDLVNFMQSSFSGAGIASDYFIGSRLISNVQYDAGDYPPSLRALMADRTRDAAAVIEAFPGYSPTPLVDMNDVARQIGVGQLYYKDEAHRFAEVGLKCFKVLGSAFALFELLAGRIELEVGIRPSPQDLLSGKYEAVTRLTTVTCATDGNYGRAVAWTATQFGCNAVIFISTAVSEAREDAIAKYGATVRRVVGVYEDAVRAAEEMAQRSGWDVLSDTGYPGCEDLPRLVTQGYTVLLAEALEQWPASQRPTHVFLQSGVGGLAASIAATLWESFGKDRPVVVVVEPIRADSAFQSAVNGRMTSAKGDLNSVCACLACGEMSTVAWEILATGAAAFMILPDSAAVESMRYLANRTPAIVAGESGALGLAGAVMSSIKPRWRAQLGLNMDSRILVIGTEGDTDPLRYQALLRSWSPE